MKNFFLTLVGIGFVVFCVYTVLQQPAPAKYQQKNMVTIGDVPVQVEVRDTPEGRAQGLSGRESLKEGTGMLFVFDTPGTYGFWMKDMNFPIDMIWIDDNRQVITVHRHVSPDSYPISYSPESDAKYVLEVPAGFADKYQIDTEDYLGFE